MEAQDHFGSSRMFDAEALGADRNTAIGTNFDGGANTPNIRPPRTWADGAQHGALFFAGTIPRLLRSHPQFAMDFVGVVMEPQRVDVRIGLVDLVDLFAGEKGWKPALPELVLALDFALGLGRWSIKEANVVELERPAQLGQRVGILGEKHGVIIDVNLQRPAVGQEGGGEEIQVGEQEFPVIDFGADEDAAAIVEHIKHGKIQCAGREPPMGRSVQLPEFADLGALPSAHGSLRALEGSGMRATILDGPVTDLGAVELEGVQAQRFRGHEAVGARWGAGEALFEEVGDRFRPDGGVVSA